VLGVGTGEAMNEAPFYGGRWPPWRERMDRLVEGVALMRKLWTSPEYLDFDSRYFSARKVFLYTKPKTSPQVLFSAVGPKAAAIAGRFGDGLITLSSRNALPELKERVLKNFDAAARAAGKNPDGMPKVLSLSFTLDDREAYVRKRKGKAGNLARGALDEPDPRVIERMGRELPAEVIAKATNFCSKWSDVIELVSRYREAGFSQIVLNTGADRELIEEYARKILSEFGSVAK
jgi:alkanesulfonate monooxygenase SsuD/methylene tetrahydromethanopterin reductase-like flavin-dependent oxidoreductase (luciferase family)